LPSKIIVVEIKGLFLLNKLFPFTAENESSVIHKITVAQKPIEVPNFSVPSTDESEILCAK
jgi:hypothetical protein